MPNVQKPNYRPIYTVDARATIANFRKRLRDQACRGESPALMQQAIQQLEAAIANGETQRMPRKGTCTNIGELHAAAPPKTHKCPFPTNQNLEITVAETISQIKTPRNHKITEVIPISAMIGEQYLATRMPIGEIDPPLEDVHFIYGEPRVPAPCGFITETNRSGTPVIDWDKAKISRKQAGGLTTHTIQFTANELRDAPEYREKPLPLGALAVTDKKMTKEFNYQITPNSNSEAPAINLKKQAQLIPTLEEQKLWRSLMPLPKHLQDNIHQYPEYLLDILMSYMTDRQFQPFHYINNPYFSKFLQTNNKDLPHIVHKLKVGHCDLLSWYLAAQIRAYGRPAWVQSVKTTINDGHNFQGAYDHSIVISVDDKGCLVELDPSSRLRFHSGYITDQDSKKHFTELAQEYKSSNDKERTLQNFTEGYINPKRDRVLASEFSNNPFSNWNPKEQGWNRTFPHQHISASPFIRQQTSIDDFIHNSGIIYTTTSDCIDFPKNPYSDRPSDPQTVIDRQKWHDYFQIAHQMRYPVTHWSTTRKELIKEYQQHPRISLNTAIKTIESWDGSVFLDFLLENIPSISNPEVIITALKRIKDKYEINEIFPPDPDYLPHFDVDTKHPLLKYQFSDVNINNIKRYGTIYFTDREYANTDHNIESTKAYLAFMVQFQRACSDAEFREEFCSHLQLNATEFQQLCYQVLDKKQGTHYQSIRPYGLPQVQPWNLDPFYNPDAHVLRGKFKREIRALLTNDTRELINEPFAARAYTPGDDIRRIDWNFWARSGKLITRSAPEASRAGNSPLYVMFDEDLFVFDQGSDKGLGTKLQFIELIKALQEERKYSDRKIFICSRYCDKFLELNSTMRPEAIANILDTIRTKNNEEQNSRPKDPDLLIADYDRIHGARLAEPPANLLYLSQSYNRIAAVEALYPNIKQRRVYLADPEFLTYPMIRNSWVQS